MNQRFPWPESHSQTPLDRVVADLLSAKLGRPVGRGLARTLCQDGKVQVNGRTGLPAMRRPKGPTKIDVQWEDTETQRDIAFDPSWVLEDRDGLLVVSKPSGLLTHASADKSRVNLVDLVRASRAEGSELTLQHRLDRDTSGLVLFTTEVYARVIVAQQFEARNVRKEYLCWVRGKRLESSWSVDAPLTERSGRVKVGPGKPSQTDFRLLRRHGEYCLLEARPVTGRKHQIRAHLAHLGLPIIGDTLFGGFEASRLMLHAYRLTLSHPELGGERSFLAEPGTDFRP